MLYTGGNGGNSVFGSITAAGGGGGGGAYGGGGAGIAGGSGGGGECLSGLYGAGNTPSMSPSQGNNGGSGNTSGGYSGGGGGGASATGNSGSGNTGGNGGTGTTNAISGTSVTYADGGGGGGYGGGGGTGGSGNGGTGGNASASAGGKGVDNTGSGGGGGAAGEGNGGNGGLGIVIIKYPVLTGSWASSDPTIATVDASGNVTGIKIGTVTISYTVTIGSCTNVQTCPVTISYATPLAAGTITGSSIVYQGQTGVSYSVPAVTYATGYVWSLPSGAAITAGANTNSIIVSYSSSASSGNITVYGTSICGNGTISSSYPVTVNTLPAQFTTIMSNGTTAVGTSANCVSSLQILLFRHLT